MRRASGQANAEAREKKVSLGPCRLKARRLVGIAAILWMAAGACAQQRPFGTVQTEARIIQMAGEAVARRAEKKKQSARGAGSQAAPQDRSKIRRIVVSIPDRKLALIEDGRVVKVYPVSVGAEATPSPVGEFRIANLVTNPAWYWPGKVIPAGATNPLGPRWMGLGHRGFGIHGTNDPRTIGRSASHGCIRLRNRDVKDLFRRVRVGDAVELHGERDATLAVIFASPQAPAAGRAIAAKFVTTGASRTVRE